MYPVKLGIKDTTESNTSAVYIGLLLFIVRDDKLHTSLYNKRDKFQVFPFYTIFARQGCFLFHIIQDRPVCSYYDCFIPKLTRIQAGICHGPLKSSVKKFNGWYENSIKEYKVPLSWMLYDDTFYRSDIALNRELVSALDL